MSRAAARRRQQQWAPWVLLVIVIALWELLCRLGNVSEFVFPAPFFPTSRFNPSPHRIVSVVIFLKFRRRSAPQRIQLPYSGISVSFSSSISPWSKSLSLILIGIAM